MEQPQKGDYLIGCDWGTTSVRLALIRRADSSVMAIVNKKEGVATIASDWKKDQNIDLKDYFFLRLQPLVQELQSMVGFPIKNVPLCISGMASSSIGLKELKYADLPLSLSGSDLVTEEMVVSGEYKVLLVSGVRSEQEVMRGEEVQIIGIQDSIQSFGHCTIVLPGTHSKHVGVTGGQIREIKTYMTGELFSVLSEHTVLKHSMPSERNFSEDMPGDDFIAGIHKRGILSNLLFGVRTGTLFGKRDVEQSRDYLLGLLIGHELAGLENHDQIVLCSSGPLLHYYSKALRYIFPNRAMILDEKLAMEAAFIGQSKIFGLKF